jgi:hypothetical protein
MALSGAPTLASPGQPVKAAILADLYANEAWAAQSPLKFPESAVPFLAGTYEDPLFDLKIGMISAANMNC